MSPAMKPHSTMANKPITVPPCEIACPSSGFLAVSVVWFVMAGALLRDCWTRGSVRHPLPGTWHLVGHSVPGGCAERMLERNKTACILLGPLYRPGVHAG